MYHALLTRKYLTSKILPLLAAGAVFLCTASVLFVWSIMGGFLTTLLDSGRTHVGDVMIEWPGAGFGYYDELTRDLESRPEILAAAPSIESVAVVQYPDKRNLMVVMLGVDPDSYHRVTGFRDFLWWKPIDEPLPKDTLARDMRVSTPGPLLAGWIPAAAMKARERALELAADNLAPAEMRSIADSLKSIADDARALAPAAKSPTEAAPRIASFLSTTGAEMNALFDQVSQLRAASIVPANRLSAVNESAPPLLINELLDLDRALVRLSRQPNLTAHFQSALPRGDALSAINPISGAEVPALVLGTEHSTYNQRRREGYYDPMPAVSVRQSNGEYAAVPVPVADYTVSVNLLPSEAASSKLDVVARTFTVVNEFKTGIYELDSKVGLVRLDYLQRFLRMDQSDIIDPRAGETIIGPDGRPTIVPATVIGTNPARVTTISVRGKPGIPLESIRDAVKSTYAAFADRHPGAVPDASQIKILTWRDKKATLVAAVEKEIVMVVMVMGVISVTVSFLILAIFWAIVREKTKDIGILRAIGASRAGVMGVWLAYALIIGIIGSVLGGILAHIAVWNINPIHDWLGVNLGITIWSPEIYYISKIPNVVEPWRAAVVMASGVFFSVLGALIPSVRAAYMDPVKALRFE